MKVDDNNEKDTTSHEMIVEKQNENSAESTAVSVNPISNVTTSEIKKKNLLEEEAFEPPGDEFEDNSKIPKLSYWKIFLLFLNFGFHAWGGPVAQIALFKDRLVTEGGWITVGRFNRVYGVYQLIPGPEATELAIYFGSLAGGRIGGVLGGLGFILPGFVLLMIFSYVYVLVGFSNQYFNASFRCLQPIVAAMGIPSLNSLGLGVAPTPSPGHIFALGLIAGTLSFGGAYTVIPIIQAEAVTIGHWMTQQTYLDALAIGNILPTPLVMFSTFIGFQAGNTFGGIGYAFLESILVTLAVFIPCFLMAVMGNTILEKMVRNKFCAAFFDGITGSVVGLIAVTALDLLKSSITTSTVLINISDDEKPIISAQHNSIAAVVYMISLAALYSFKTPYLPLLLVIFGAIAGQFLFV
ncbi:5553_t:CDS:2 [Funneliformis mosseae]|uniref:5553_t:CDS:1 n=1 Tax=Funneliformis mosseae TaxID=27381 RepID=A0A9N9D5K3_FUNMO|nr:5553_t:CDS:2 [Funneliformis mosseae]